MKRKHTKLRMFGFKKSACIRIFAAFPQICGMRCYAKWCVITHKFADIRTLKICVYSAFGFNWEFGGWKFVNFYFRVKNHFVRYIVILMTSLDKSDVHLKWSIIGDQFFIAEVDFSPYWHTVKNSKPNSELYRDALYSHLRILQQVYAKWCIIAQKLLFKICVQFAYFRSLRPNAVSLRKITRKHAKSCGLSHNS